jgi:hypothetical protein
MSALAVIASQLNIPSLFTSSAGFSVFKKKCHVEAKIIGKLSFLLQYTNVRTIRYHFLLKQIMRQYLIIASKLMKESEKHIYGD